VKTTKVFAAVVVIGASTFTAGLSFGQQPAPAPGPLPAQPSPAPVYAPPPAAPAPGPLPAQPSSAPVYAPPPAAPPPVYQQQPAPPGYAPPGYAPPGYAPPGYAPPADPTIHFHDGFYLSMAIGGAYLNDSAKVEGSTFEMSISGGGVFGELAIGGTPTPGLVIGGASMAASIPSPKVKMGDIEGTADASVNLSTVGPFIAYYPNPREGLHFGAYIGYAMISAQNNNTGTTSSNNPAGPAFALTVGNEWWVGEQWGIGISGRFLYAPLKYETTVLTATYKETDSVIVPSVLFTATYH
jgi:hypothetical protein